VRTIEQQRHDQRVIDRLTAPAIGLQRHRHHHAGNTDEQQDCRKRDRVVEQRSAPCTRRKSEVVAIQRHAFRALGLIEGSPVP
jgi:hypothetical protein